MYIGYLFSSWYMMENISTKNRWVVGYEKRCRSSRKVTFAL